MMSSVNLDDFAHLKIPLEDVISATNNFSEENVRGGGPFGVTYIGKLLWSGELIDINVKRWNKEWDEKEQQFLMEVSMLSSLEHKNLVSFVGFCDENDERIVIFKRVLGSLDSLVCFSTIFPWVRRLMICVGLAEALGYIHHDEHRDFSVIHRNIDSGAILLDENFEPKLSEFSHSMKIEASKRHDSFHVDKVWDMAGYTDPTYIQTKIVSHKSDIYSFGIVMFELLCGRTSVIANDINKYLLHYREKRLHEIIDWELWDQMDSQSFNVFAGIAYDCLNEEPSQRPNIDEIVTILYDALILQLEKETSSPKDEFHHLRIPFENILSATNNLDDEKFKAISGIGECYKGQLLWSGELIDILAHRLNKDLNDAEEMFWTEISLLSSLKHKNVVSLVGFCDEDGEKIIITRHYTPGWLASYLSDPMLLTWAQRLEISVGLAHALSYIYYDESRDFSVIHRNIDCSRILLNDDWEPKLSSFESSMKIKASQRHHSFHTNRRRYIVGLTDPTYIESQSVNHKSDIYSFGVVLFELLCGRNAVISNGQDNKYLVPVALFHYREKTLDEIIDPVLRKQMDLQSFNVFAKTAYECLNEERSQRPNIDEIVARLESALKFQMERQNVFRRFSLSSFLNNN